MVPEASNIIVRSAIKSESTLVRPHERLFGGKFARAARAIWPHKTAAHLAAAAHVSERAAEYWLAGQREPSARAIRAIVDEITP